MVGILRRTPIFGELVKRFAAGQSVIQVADWSTNPNLKGLGAFPMERFALPYSASPRPPRCRWAKTTPFVPGRELRVADQCQMTERVAIARQMIGRRW